MGLATGGLFVQCCQASAIEREFLTVAQLDERSNIDIKQPLSFTALTMPEQAIPSKLRLQGSLRFSPITAFSHLAVVEQSEVYQFERRTRPEAFTPARAFLPEISINVVQSGQHIIPVKRDLQLTEHAHWDYIVGVGDIWQEAADSDYSRVSMPFALVEKNQNCVHNGVLSFLVNEHSETTDFYYQISSETCLYYKADMWGKGNVAYSQKNIENGPEVVDKYLIEQKNRFPVKPLSQLKQQFPAINLDNIALAKSIRTQDLSSVAVVLNGQQYVADCMTRFGLYPFCAQLVLPSYSTAKSIFAGIAMVYLEQRYPAIFEQRVSEWITQCDSEKWRDVTFAHLLNMSTGNYHAIGHAVDEGAEHSQLFFKAKTHKQKLQYSCEQFEHQQPPGTAFVYHTSDTYLLGSALNEYLKAQLKKQHKPATTIVFEHVFVNQLWPLLQLSPVAFSTRKTADARQQAFTGYGLFFTRDDIAKIAHYLMNTQSRPGKHLHSKRLQKMLKHSLTGDELSTQYEFIRYHNGFWKQNITDALGCENDTWLPYMMGYGGIAIILINQNMQYYYFSDSDQYSWRDAIKELDKITPLCRQ